MFSIFKTFFLSLCIIANVNFAYAQTASILPPAKTTFVDQNGKPLTSGTVDFYIPNTSTRKATWKDAAETILNQNPVVLDEAGRALILGSGSYRQVVKDRLSNIIWDQVTSSTGSGNSTPTATGDGDLVGTIKPWAGLVAPNQYMFAYGQELSRITYSALLTALTSSQSAFCTSGSPILTGLADTSSFPDGGAIEVSCIAAGHTTVVSKTSTTVTMAVNANVNTNTTALFFPWGNGNNSTTFNAPDFRGMVPVGNNNMGGSANIYLTQIYYGNNPNSIGALGGSQNNTILDHNLPAYTPVGTIANGAITNVVTGGTKGAITTSSAVAAAGHAFADVGSDIVVSSSQATSTFTGTPAAGRVNDPLGVVQPSKTTNYIVKVTPDTNSATASGVTSLGGMTGDIACGTGTSCTGNILSVTLPSIFGATTFFTSGFNPSTNNDTALTTTGGFGGGFKFTDTKFLGLWSSSSADQFNIGLSGTASGWTSPNTYTFSSSAFTIPSTASVGLVSPAAFLERVGLVFQAKSSGATISGIASSATVAKVFDGSLVSPHTANTPSMSVYRTEAQNSATLTGNAPALWVETVANNTGAGNPNANAFIAVATQDGKGDVVGVVGSGVTHLGAGTGYTAFGGNFDAESYVVGGRAFAIETFTANRTGVDVPYTGPIPSFTGLHLAAGGTNLNTAALWINSLTAPTSWDVGIAFTENSIKTASIQDDSLSPTILKATSNHTNGIDLSGATIATSAFKSSGFNVTGSGVITGIGTGLTGTAAGLTSGNVTTNANLTGPIASVGNATSITSQTGTGTTFAMSVGPTFTGVPAAPTAAAGTNTTQIATTAGIVAERAATKTLTNTTYDTAGSGNSFSINGVAVTANTGTGSVARQAGPTFTTPILGAATATTLNGNTFTTGTYTLTGTAGKTLTFSNSLTLAGTDATTLTFQGTDTYVGRATTDTLTNKTLTTPVINGTITGTTVIPVANGGTADTGTVWPTYAVTVGCTGGGAAGTAAGTGTQKSIGKTQFFQIDLSTGTATCGTGFTLTLPSLPQSTPIFTAFNKSTNGSAIAYAPVAGTASATMTTAVAVSQFLSVTGFYGIQ